MTSMPTTPIADDPTSGGDDIRVTLKGYPIFSYFTLRIGDWEKIKNNRKISCKSCFQSIVS